MRIKIVLSLFMVSLLTGGLFPSAFAATGFTDVGTAHPNYEAITELQNLGVIQGYPDGTFKPEQVVNRVEALKIILGGSGIDVSQSIGAAAFADTSATEWYAKYLKKAVDLNIVQGYPDGTFKPSQTVNLVESLKILLITNHVNFSAITVSGNPYADAYADQWYSKYVQYAKNNALIDADSANRVYPDGGMTRAKLAEAMYRLMQLQDGAKDEPVVEPQSTTLTEEIVMELLENISAAETLDEKYQYLSAAKATQMKNLATMARFWDGSDPSLDDIMTEDHLESNVSMISSLFLPYIGNYELFVDELKNINGYNKAVIKSISVDIPENAALCLGLVYEKGFWKMDAYSVGYIEILDDNCVQTTKMPETLTNADLTMGTVSVFSEYEYSVYLNDHMIFSGSGMQAMSLYRGIPLKDGPNRVHIHIENSTKDEGDESPIVFTDFKFSLKVDGETLVDEVINEENVDKYIDFTFSK